MHPRRSPDIDQVAYSHLDTVYATCALNMAHHAATYLHVCGGFLARLGYVSHDVGRGPCVPRDFDGGVDSGSDMRSTAAVKNGEQNVRND